MSFALENSIKAICFDIDGTLYPKWMTDVYLASAAISHPIFSLKYNKTRQIVRVKDGLEGEMDLSKEAFRKKEASILGYKDFETYKMHYLSRIYNPWQGAVKRFIRPYDGMKDALLKAKEKGLILAALSDFPIGNKIEVLGLEGVFDYIASTEDSGYLKPNRIPFITMLEKLSLKADEALYCGDSYRKDIQGSKNAGMHSLWLCSKDVDAAKYPEADLIMQRWDQFVDLVL